MTVTTLDQNTVLLVVDLQKGVVAMPCAHPMGPVVANAAKLAEAFRRHRLPVVLINAAGVAQGRSEQGRKLTDLPADWIDLVPELNRQPGDHLVTKRTWGAFSNTGLDAWLKERKVTQVVVAGVATSAGVESTARFAHELGYNVTLAVDAMTDMSQEAHDNSVKRIFPRLGETGTADAIVALLDAGEGRK